MKRRSSLDRTSPRGAARLGASALAVCWASLASGCLNPRPEELPSETGVPVLDGADENEPPRAPNAPAPVPGGGGYEPGSGAPAAGDPGEQPQPSNPGAADAGAPDAGLRALDTGSDCGSSDSPAGDEPE